MKRAGLLAMILLLSPLSSALADEAATVVEPSSPAHATQPADRWTTMVHGYAFLVSNRQGGRLGERRFESVNHFMVISTRRRGQDSWSLLGTFTLEPATVPVEGSPQLFQRGETFQDRLLVDRQHPHDLFVQIAAQWERSLSARTAVRIYVAPWGEPALGPTAYPHRLSASENPAAPLAHHNQDSTHISADVVTAGVRLANFTIEGSAFHGAEPDENRWDIDQGGIDSYSGRVSYRTEGGFAFQISAGHRRHPEALEEGGQTRQTASVEYIHPLTGGFVAASLILGRNLLEDGSEERGDGLEATWKFRGSSFLYGRLEDVDRDRYELIFKSQRPASIPPDRTTVQAATMGYVRNLPLLREAETGFGGDLTVYRFDSDLDGVYGKGPVSLQLFLRVRFGTHQGGDHLHH